MSGFTSKFNTMSGFTSKFNTMSGFTFDLIHEEAIRSQLIDYAENIRRRNPLQWESKVHYDCSLPSHLVNLPLAAVLEDMKPFGHGFEEPKFLIEGEIIDCK